MRLIDADLLKEKIIKMYGKQATADGIVKNDILEVIHYLETDRAIETPLPYNPIACAEMLIDATYERETSSIQRALGASEMQTAILYSIDELRQIAEHLLVYCNHNEYKGDSE